MNFSLTPNGVENNYDTIGDFAIDPAISSRSDSPDSSASTVSSPPYSPALVQLSSPLTLQNSLPGSPEALNSKFSFGSPQSSIVLTSASSNNQETIPQEMSYPVSKQEAVSPPCSSKAFVDLPQENLVKREQVHIPRTSQPVNLQQVNMNFAMSGNNIGGNVGNNITHSNMVNTIHPLITHAPNVSNVPDFFHQNDNQLGGYQTIFPNLIAINCCPPIFSPSPQVNKFAGMLPQPTFVQREAQRISNYNPPRPSTGIPIPTYKAPTGENIVEIESLLNRSQLAIRQDGFGINWITFSFPKNCTPQYYTIRCDTESVDITKLSNEFKRENSMYPRVYISGNFYKSNRQKYESECNCIGWSLAYLNPKIRKQRGVIQRAVDHWRNTNVNSKYHSRRIQRNKRNQRRAARANSPARMAAAPTVSDDFDIPPQFPPPPQFAFFENNVQLGIDPNNFRQTAETEYTLLQENNHYIMHPNLP